MTLRLTAAEGGRAVGEEAPLLAGPSVIRTTLLILAATLGVVAVLWTLYRLAGVLLLLVLAVFFAYLVAPLVERLRRTITLRGRQLVLPLPAAIAAVYVLVFGSITVACILLLPPLDSQLGQLAREVPSYVTRVEAHWQSWQTGYRGHALPQEVRDAVDRAARQAVTAGGTYLTNELVPRLAGWLVYLPWLILVPILAFFLLKDAEAPAQVRSEDSSPGPPALARARVPRRAQRHAGGLHSRPGDGLSPHRCGLHDRIPRDRRSVRGRARDCGWSAGIHSPGRTLTIGVVATGFAAFHSLGQAVAVLLFLWCSGPFRITSSTRRSSGGEFI